MDPALDLPRVDLIHRRVDEAVAQSRAGHIITECIVLHPGEHGAEGPVRWTVPELVLWEKAARSELIDRIGRHPRYMFSIWHAETGVLLAPEMAALSPDYKPDFDRGRIAYRDSAIVLARHPRHDVYAERRKDEAAIERQMAQAGHHSAPLTTATRAFPVAARNPR